MNLGPGDERASRRPLTAWLWRAVRAGALLAALAFLHLEVGGTLCSAVAGAGLAYVILSIALLGSGQATVAGWRWRLAADTALVVVIAWLGGREAQVDLRFLLIVPVLEAAALYDAETVLLTVLLAAVAVAITIVWRPEAGYAGPGALAGAVAVLAVVGIASARVRAGLVAGRLAIAGRGALQRREDACRHITDVMHTRPSAEALAAALFNASLYLVDGHAATIVLRAYAGETPEWRSEHTRGPAPPEPQPPPEGQEYRLTPAPDGFGTVVTIVLRGAAGQVIGHLALLDPRPAEYIAADELEALVALAHLAGVGFDQVRLTVELDERDAALVSRLNELAGLFEVSRALVTVHHGEVVEQVLDHAISLMGAERGSLMLLDEETGELRITSARGLPPELVESTRVKLGEGFSGTVASTGRPLRLLETLEPGPAREGVRDALCVPLKLQDQVIGVLNVSNKTGPGVFSDHDLEFLSALANQVAIAVHNARLFEELQELFLSTISSLAKAVDAADPTTAGHSYRVMRYALAIAETLALSPAERDVLRAAALMHDIGKIGVPEGVLKKPGPLEEAEWHEMRAHPLLGAGIVGPIRPLQSILPGVRWHHERPDGEGYPDRLPADSIPLQARILAVADAYDAMTSDRPYRSAMPDERALEILRQGRGSQWDVEVVDAFLAAYERGAVAGIRGSMPPEEGI